MITGKDVIIYILENDLVDKVVISEADVSDIFLTMEEVAIKFDTGIAVIEALYELGMIKGYDIGGHVYFSKNIQNPKGDAKVNAK